MTEETETCEQKKPRKRIKKLLNEAKTQLEFYFSDANLRHDRFLRKEITDNKKGYVDLETMLKFNKLKTLTTDVSILVKAIESSSFLKLNSEKTKLKRVSEIPELENVDGKTVYVEQLPENVDHTWLKEVFSKCGTVDYISLPRFSHNNKVKGFAFIEFSSEAEAKSACKTLNSVPSAKEKHIKRKSLEKALEIQKPKVKTLKRRRSKSISESDSDMAKSRKRNRSTSESSVESSSKTKKDEKETVKKDEKETVEKDEKETVKKDEKETVEKESNENEDVSKKKKKRKKSTDEENSNELKNKITKTEDKVSESTSEKSPNKQDSLPKKSKKNKGENVLEKEKVETVESCDNVVKKKKCSENCDVSKTTKDINTGTKENTDNSDHETTDTENNEAEKKKKKNRKHKRKEKDLINTPPPLYVISKEQWLALKKQYKELQKKSCREIKSNLRLLESEKVRQMELKERIHKSIQAKQQKQEQYKKPLHNNYPNKQQKQTESHDQSHDQQESTNENQEKPKLDIMLGTVVSMKVSNENAKRKEIKDVLMSHGVAYVDYIDGNSQGYIRFKTKEDVDTLLKQDSVLPETVKVERLDEPSEKAYFKKAEEDKKKNYELNEKKKRRKKERGVEKLARKLDGY